MSMSPDRPQFVSDDGDGGPILELPNMVLSSVPTESGHVIIQEQTTTTIPLQQYQTSQAANKQLSPQQQQPQQKQQQQQLQQKPFNIKNSSIKNQQIFAIASDSESVDSALIKSSITASMPSSKLLVLQQNHLNSDSSNGNSYLNGQDGNKIVLVTTEQMDIGSSTENNQNGSITTVSTNNTNDEELTSLTWLHDKNLLKGINLSASTNVKHVNNNNHIKLVADHSVRHHSQQSSSSGAITPTSDYVDDSCVSEDNVSSVNSDQGSIYSNNNTAETSPSSYHYISAASPHTINNNNNSVNNKNRNPNQLTHTQPPPATSIIHLSPGGSTVIEYKTTSHLQQKLSTVTTSNSTGGANQSAITSNGVDSNGAKVLSVTSVATTASSQSTPHTHFHKKYIKQMNALYGGTSTATALVSSAGTIVSSPTTITMTSPTTYTIPINQDYSPCKYEHETVIVENEYPHANITLSSNHFPHNDIDRHDDYVTPKSSPRQPQQPATPQKTISVNTAQSPASSIITSNSMGQSPVGGMTPTSPSAQNKQKHPNNLPYDPFIHTNNKPPLSFSSLIFLAIEDAKEKALPVKEIYSWIVQHYPYFKTAPTGWKNSVRHNLSLNKCFQKVEKAPNMGKGSLWRVEQQYKQNLIIALTRSSYHPNTTAMEKATASLKNTPRSPESPPLKTNARPVDAELFPRLSKFMANMTNGNNNTGNSHSSVISNNHHIDSYSPSHASIDEDYQMHSGTVEYHANGDGVISHSSPNNDHEMHVVNGISDIEAQQANVERIARDWGVDSIDDVNAATAMLALKHGPKVFAETFQTGTPIITSVPSEDHTYSAGGTGKRSTSVNGTPLNSSSNINNTINIITTTNLANNQMNSHINSDNNSSGTSSDAAYESSEESQNTITAEELEARRHQEGVDAFLSFATEVSSMSSPIKRPPSADYVDSVAGHHFNNNHIVANNNNTNHSDNGSPHNYYYYDGGSSPSTMTAMPLTQHHQQHVYSYLSTPSPPKKSRTRTLRTKLKKKSWMR